MLLVYDGRSLDPALGGCNTSLSVWLISLSLTALGGNASPFQTGIPWVSLRAFFYSAFNHWKIHRPLKVFVSLSVIYNKSFPLFLVQSEQLDYLYESTSYNMHWTGNPTSQTRARTPLFSPGRKADRAISLHYSLQLTQQRKWNTKWQMCFGFPTVWYQVW